MRPPVHLVRLYNRTVRRYRKLTTRLNRQADPDSFGYRTLVSKLKKLRRKLNDLHYQLKIAVAAGVIVVGAAIQEAQAQNNPGPFERLTRGQNPLRPPLTFSGSIYPALIDLDNDGDYDLVAGASDYSYDDYGVKIQGPIRYFVNVGTDKDPMYEEATGAENPFSSLEIFGEERQPVFVDLDNDGDEDLFVGLDYQIRYYRNEGGTFVEQTGSWDAENKTGNPFDWVDAGDSGQGEARIAFADLNGDGHPDAVLTGEITDPDTGSSRFVSFFINDGEGNFTDASEAFSMLPSAPTKNWLVPALVDVDGDGDHDLLLGDPYVGILYFEQVSPGVFEEKTTENPFALVNDDNGNSNNLYTHPAMGDLDGDGDLDLLVGMSNPDWNTRFNQIKYFRNDGAQNFEELLKLENPVGGVMASRMASPVVIDIDQDGDLDAILGQKYSGAPNTNQYIEFYESDGEVLHYVHVDDSPLGKIENSYYSLVPKFGDVDGDGDLDMIVPTPYGIRYFVNEGGVFLEAGVEDNPFADIVTDYQTVAELVDIDGDGDLDVVWSNYYGLNIHENTGSPSAPVFELIPDDQNPLFELPVSNLYYFHFADIDHDGDVDLFVTEYLPDLYRSSIQYFENTGSATAPAFTLSDVQPFHDHDWTPDELYDHQLWLVDYDGDGDLDSFVGVYDGLVIFLKNENPPPQVAVNTTPLQYLVGVDTEVFVDETLQLSDEDDDLIVMATVTITNFQEGDKLSLDSYGSISASFDSDTGVLTLLGTATAADYQAALRLVLYEHDPAGDLAGMRKRSPASVTILKSFETRVFDSDFTTPPPVTRNLEVIINSPPLLNPATVTLHAGGIATVDLEDLVEDPDGNQDLSTLAILQQPASGASAHVNAGHQLVVDYSELPFVGEDHIEIEICDSHGMCGTGMITLQVENQPPLLETQTLTVVAGQSVSLDVTTLITDPDGESDIDLTSLKITEPPESGAAVSVNADGLLTADYTGLSFTGTETIGLEVCDISGACVQGVITVQVENNPPVIADAEIGLAQGEIRTVNLLDITSDQEGNLDPEGFSIVSPPSSGAIASIEVVSEEVVNLIIDYTGITYKGTDQLTLRSCDRVGACSDKVLQVSVETSAAITVYNAVAPSSAGDNKFMRIANLPEQNRVRIYNRWGDLVFDMSNYNDQVPGRRFEGRNDNGSALASGTYFYRIDALIAGGQQEEITGYVVLKQ